MPDRFFGTGKSSFDILDIRSHGLARDGQNTAGIAVSVSLSFRCAIGRSGRVPLWGWRAPGLSRRACSSGG